MLNWVSKAWQNFRQPAVRDKSKSFNDFVRAVKEKNYNRIEKIYGSRFEQAQVRKSGTMGETSGAIGGYIVPPEFSFQIMQCLVENSFLYPRANVIPMTSLTTQCPVVDVVTTQSAGTFATVGGILLQWGLSLTPTATNPTFRQVNLTAWDLIGITTISNQMLMDTGPDGESALAEMFGRAGAAYAEYAFFQGTGTAQMMPLGIIKAPGTFQQARQNPNQISGVDVSNMAGNWLPLSWGGGIWACSPSTIPQITQISGFTPNMWIPTMPVSGNGMLGFLLGHPVFVTEKLPPLGTPGDLVLLDPWLYVIGNRQEVLVDVSDQQLFQTAQTMFRIWLRMDGKPLNSGLITLIDGTTQVSPFVMLV